MLSTCSKVALLRQAVYLCGDPIWDPIWEHAKERGVEPATWDDGD